MIRSRVLVCLAAVISLFFGAIWPNTAAAVVAPAVVSLGSIEVGLSVPGKLDLDATGNLYVADITGHKVLKFDASGDLLRSYDAVPASGRGLAVSPDGSRLYVATDDQVAILDGLTGAVVGQILLAGAGEIDLDATGNVYIVDFATVQVKVYDQSGDLLYAFGGYGIGDGQFKSIDAMSVNEEAGEVYVIGLKPDMNIDDCVVVQISSLAGVYQGILTEVDGKIGSSSGIVFDVVGREYYLDKLASKIHVRPRVFSTDFPNAVSFDIGGSGAGKVLQPWDIAFDPLTSRLFVSSDTGEIEIFGVDGGTTPEKNLAPGLPALISPVANSEAAALQPQLSFANAVDLNGDSLTYDLQITGTPALQYSVAENTSGTTTLQIDQDLVENAAYSWQVMAKDGELDSGWTLAQTFYVNSIEEAPSAPVLSSALAGGTIGGADLLLWQASVDNDPLDTVNYLVEISADNTFAAPVIAEMINSETAISLGALVDYQSLLPGNIYFWRVTAVDSSDLETVSAELGSFRYETAMLTVQANLPGAKVYLAGNAAYSGNFVGTVPFEQRDMAAGPYTVVVERAGCETFIAQVELSAVGSVQVNANLLLAVVPQLKKASVLRSVKSQLQSAALVAPFIVDFDNDDMADLLVGDEAGAVSLFRALAKRGSKVQYGAAESLDFGQLPGTALFVVDWNNDNKKDVLVGAANGTVSIYQQKADSSDLSPEFDPALFLRDGKGSVVNVGSQANPTVFDIDGDSDKDLIIGTGDGKVYLYLNNGSDEAPALAIDPVSLISFASGSVSPLFVDWDADGSRDLLVASAGSLLRCKPNTDGTYSVAEVLVDAVANNIADGARFFVVDADNSQGKDIYLGLADGQVKIMRSSGKDFLPSVTGALLDKLAQVSDLAVASAVVVTVEVEAASVEISAGNFGAAGRTVKKIVAVSPIDSALYDAAAELIALLNQ